METIREHKDDITVLDFVDELLGSGHRVPVRATLVREVVSLLLRYRAMVHL